MAVCCFLNSGVAATKSGSSNRDSGGNANSRTSSAQ
eukprot:CAMPEP_0175034108 /NCGR_PEP_ID=MMETSP0005-20121125/22416_1 /TAXON_ID=420556 /ORGANISM="Ochromonas sp., Strain CCMP1393" /LENGTH=35 /DNA_ID= /DNA_START= /DNA_END= /DNA_ORIENTATION=